MGNAPQYPILEAWHATHDGFCEFAKNGCFEDINLGKSHIHVATCIAGVPSDEDESHLEWGFNYFNWQTQENFGQAPDAVNDICRLKDTHASMTAGDIIIEHLTDRVIVWLCDSLGWKKIITCQEIK